MPESCCHLQICSWNMYSLLVNQNVQQTAGVRSLRVRNLHTKAICSQDATYEASDHSSDEKYDLSTFATKQGKIVGKMLIKLVGLQISIVE